MIYGYLRTSRAAVDGLAGMHPETQVQALADAGVEPASIVSDVGISGSVPAGDRPGWSGLHARLLRSDTVTVAALDRSAATGLAWCPSWSRCAGAGSASLPWLPPSPGSIPGRPVPGPSQGIDPRPDHRHPPAAPQSAVPVRGGEDLWRLPPDRLARRAAGVAAMTPRNSLGRGRFAFSAGWPAYSAAASRAGVAPGAGIGGQAMESRTGGGLNP